MEAEMRLLMCGMALAAWAAPAFAQNAFGTVTPINLPVFDRAEVYRQAQEIELQRQQIELQQMELEWRQVIRSQTQA